MKRFQNNVINKNVSEAIKVAEDLLLPTSPMMEEVRVKNDWQYSSGNGFEVFVKLISEKDLLPIFTYRPFNRFTSAIGYFDGKATHFNIYKLESLSVLDIFANLLHEYSHYCGFHHIDAGWLGKRRSNYKTQNKCLYSVPYFISENISKGRWL